MSRTSQAAETGKSAQNVADISHENDMNNNQILTYMYDAVPVPWPLEKIMLNKDVSHSKVKSFFSGAFSLCVQLMLRMLDPRLPAEGPLPSTNIYCARLRAVKDIDQEVFSKKHKEKIICAKNNHEGRLETKTTCEKSCEKPEQLDKSGIIIPEDEIKNTRNHHKLTKTMKIKIEEITEQGRSVLDSSKHQENRTEINNNKNEWLCSSAWKIPDPGSQKLSWNKPPLTVLVVRKINDAEIIYPFNEIVTWLIEEKNMLVYADSEAIDGSNIHDDPKFLKIKQKLIVFQEDEEHLSAKIDFLVCLGGDGTLIHASSLFQQSVPPVMAFNMGSLGFLTPFQFCQFKEEINRVLEGNASLLLRYRLKCVIWDENSDSDIPSMKHFKKSTSDNMFLKTHLVLNEIVVDRGSTPYLCNIDLYIEGRLVTSVQGDGLIISTPTGSTAYAVAAGASMIHPNVPCILITPICPHSLSFRPIVVPAGVEIKLMLSPEARSTAWVSFDGRNRKEINQGDSVRITTATYPIPSICAKDQINDWFDGLADCLHWNVRKQQKALPSMSSTASLNSLVSD